MKILVIFGPPGVGKGTQAEILAKKANVEHVSTGAILRAEVEKGSDIGKKADIVMKSGNLVSDDIIIKIIEKYLSESESSGFLFDGFPRNVIQAEMFLSMLKMKNVTDIKVVNLDADENELLTRLLKRAKLEKRADDNKKTILSRIKIYHAQTKPVIDFLKSKNIKIIDINGVGDINKIAENVYSAVLT